jgi:Pyruvate phosphate dikinase, AMP/ATP-binding domain
LASLITSALAGAKLGLDMPAADVRAVSAADDVADGKGANLAEMTKLGLPVPPSFTITIDAAVTICSTGRCPKALLARW